MRPEPSVVAACEPQRRARVFVRAEPRDDAAIRALLRETPMPGHIRLTLEREPAFLPRAPGEARAAHTFVCRETRTGRILGLAQRALLQVWCEGRPRVLGYLAQLRRVSGVVPTRALLQAGFEACEATRTAEELPFDLTSILEGNLVARRLLERGLPGLPRYERLCRFVTRTLAVDASACRRARRPAPAGIELRDGRDEDVPALLELLARTQAAHPLALVCGAEELRPPGLAPQDFQLAWRGARLVGCAALWDQRAFKQTVVRGYTLRLELARRLLGPVAWLCGRRALPAPGSVLALAFLAHLALEEREGAAAAELHTALVRAILATARARGLHHVVTGFAEGHPLLSVARAEFRARELYSRIYRVHQAGRSSPPLPGIPHLEVALL